MIPYGHQWIDEEDIQSVIDVLKGDWITTGPKIREFETALSESIGCRYAVAVNSGTSALDIAVQALDLAPGSEIITTPFTFVATPNAALFNGVKPVFADIEERTRNIDPEDIIRKITPKTRAIISVDFAGHPCDVDEIAEIARENDLIFIEDACHAIGAQYRRRNVGTLADMTIFSFHPVKNITTGEGGAVVTGNDELSAKLRILRNHGIDRSAQERSSEGASWAYDMKYLGRNYRMTDFQAALGISQLKRLEVFIHRRQEIADLYNELLEPVQGVTLPIVKPDVRHAWHLYTILVRDRNRDRVIEELRKRGVGANVHYIPAYHFTYYQKAVPTNPSDFPVTESIFRRIITLPLFPLMQDRAAVFVAETLKKVLKHSL